MTRHGDERVATRPVNDSPIVDSAGRWPALTVPERSRNKKPPLRVVPCLAPWQQRSIVDVGARRGGLLGQQAVDVLQFGDIQHDDRLAQLQAALQGVGRALGLAPATFVETFPTIASA
jgi:hypothetical protein